MTVPTIPTGYTITHTTPSVETYISLRTSTGLTPFSIEASTRGLPNTLFAVQILHKGEAVGIRRITGDGGCFFSITDICTHPSHRGQGLAKAVMAELTRWLEVEEHVPKGAWVGLSADGQAGGLYRQFGFRETKEAFDSVGMARVM